MLLLMLLTTILNTFQDSTSLEGNVGNYKNRAMYPVTHLLYILVSRNAPFKTNKLPSSNITRYRVL